MYKTRKNCVKIHYVCFGNFYLKSTHDKGSRKKKSSTNGRAIKRGGGGGKGRAIKEKITFFILLPFKNKKYLTLDNLSKYGNITSKFFGRYFYLLVTIFSKK